MPTSFTRQAACPDAGAQDSRPLPGSRAATRQAMVRARRATNPSLTSPPLTHWPHYPSTPSKTFYLGGRLSGFVALDKAGRYGAAASNQTFPFAVATSGWSKVLKVKQVTPR